MEEVSFRAKHHRITKLLERYAEELLASGYTNKEVSGITGIGQGVVKAIDKDRLRREYTERKEEGRQAVLTLRRPKEYARQLGIDEFKLHKGNRFATHIIDMETGHILWIGHGKRKQIVYDFIEHVGEEWMSHVEAVACDMNSDYEEAFEERCEWIQPVFDYFHIVKNFNEDVVDEVRKDEQRRLEERKDYAGAQALKKTKYILTSKRSTLQRKDREAAEGKILMPGSELFHQPEVKRHGGYEAKYNELLKENKLLFTLDLIKEQLRAAYEEIDETEMANRIADIMDMCNASGNKHLKRFARLLDRHFTGIIAHATFRISSGKIEGINNKIKTIRRQAYGIPDDEYFFLKVIDASYRTYVRNPKSHMFSH
jgi:transposase